MSILMLGVVIVVLPRATHHVIPAKHLPAEIDKHLVYVG